MCLLLAPVLIGFYLLQPLTVLMKQTRQVVHAVKQSILLRCLWLAPQLFLFATGANSWDKGTNTDCAQPAVSQLRQCGGWADW
jgi:hypothetical protein